MWNLSSVCTPVVFFTGVFTSNICGYAILAESADKGVKLSVGAIILRRCCKLIMLRKYNF